MKKNISILVMMLLCCVMQSHAVADNVVQVVYDGTTATVTIASNISSYVTVSSGTSSHVVIEQNSNFAGVDATSDNEDGEIYYVLSGSSTDGSFTLIGSYKCEIDLKGLTLTNPSGPVLIILNGKRIAISSQKSTTNTLTDGSNEDYKGCIHVKGHTKLKGKGTLNVIGNSAHAIWSNEYVEVKNVTLNITAAQKDGIHCKEYFLMESGTVNICGAGDDGIHVELDGTTSTGTTTDHEDEDSGNFYMEDGTLTINGYSGKAVKTDGSISYSGGTQNFDTTDVTENATSTGVETLRVMPTNEITEYYDLMGRSIDPSQAKGIIIVKNNGKNYKIIKK